MNIPEEANATVVLVVPLQNGQQILAVMQSQLADVDQVLLINGAQNGPSSFTPQGLLGLQTCKPQDQTCIPQDQTCMPQDQTCIPQVWHRQKWHHHWK
jgi:hypothetical protein